MRVVDRACAVKFRKVKIQHAARVIILIGFVVGRPLSHARSRTAFAGVNQCDSLVRLYCEMIGLELMLKDPSPQWPRGHDLFFLLSNQFDAVIDTYVIQLRQDLSQLKCTDPGGETSPIMLDKYPGIRYIHRSGDMPNGATDAQIDAIRDLLSQIYQWLDNAHGVTP